MSTSTTAPAQSIEASPTSPRTGTAAETESKAAPSFLSSDLTVEGDLISAGDIAVEGKIEGNCQAHLVTVGEEATIKGELVADDVVVQGRVIGRLRGLKVRLSASAHVEGDIYHKTLAVESGAHFEGSVQRQDDPIGNTSRPTSVAPVGNTGTAGSAAREAPDGRTPG